MYNLKRVALSFEFIWVTFPISVEKCIIHQRQISHALRLNILWFIHTAADTISTYIVNYWESLVNTLDFYLEIYNSYLNSGSLAVARANNAVTKVTSSCTRCNSHPRYTRALCIASDDWPVSILRLILSFSCKSMRKNWKSWSV